MRNNNTTIGSSYYENNLCIIINYCILPNEHETNRCIERCTLLKKYYNTDNGQLYTTLVYLLSNNVVCREYFNYCAIARTITLLFL